jgi:S-adenosylmethionine:tRNA ribosyltransferase-isomerase
MLLSDFQYEYSPELIARYPLSERSASRLLCLDGNTGALTHSHFADLLSFVTDKDLIVFNDTRVIPARFWGVKDTGGKIEVLVERILDTHRILALVRSSKPLRLQGYLTLGEGLRFEVMSRQADLYELRCDDARDVLAVIEEQGQIPLPPYFQREPDASDIERYQTVYAKHKGSDNDMLQKIRKKGIETAYLTLHVGAGTFMPVRVDNIEEHRMHSEYIEVPESVCEQIKKTKARGGRVIAVGTTSARSLETASRSGKVIPFSGNTDIFIYPGFQFHCVDVLFTNFHAPASSLLMLVSAFAGHQHIMAAYQEAIAQQYRFFSYGDAMLLTRKTI